MKITIIIAFAFFITFAITIVHPTPMILEIKTNSISLGHLCNIFHFPSNHQLIDAHYYFNKITKRLNNNLSCPKSLTYLQDKHTPLHAIRKSQLKAQAYQINIDQKGIQLNYGDYSGYIYALQTLSQLITDQSLPHCYIKDQPKFEHRGIMIDTARHFLKLTTIQKLIDTMPLSKLNIIHWHLMDDQSFPIVLGSHPELAQYGNYSSQETYTIQEIKSLISHATKNGIKIIPEINTPAHMRSWFQSPTWKTKNVTISCNTPSVTAAFCNQLDPSKTEALQLVKEVLAQIDDVFKASPYLHLGGDDINFNCWDARPAIKKTFMKLHLIKEYQGLVEFWRFEVKQALPSSRKVVYWINQPQNYSTSQKDILQFSGHSSHLKKVIDSTSSKIILSPYDLLDLSAGLSNIWMNDTNNNYNTWRHIYQNYTQLLSSIDANRILGAQLLLWGTVINDDNFENNAWMRAAVFGERLWSATMIPTSEYITTMVKIQRSLEAQGIDASPLTSQYCERKPERCFPIVQNDPAPLPAVLIQ